MAQGVGTSELCESRLFIKAKHTMFFPWTSDAQLPTSESDFSAPVQMKHSSLRPSPECVSPSSADRHSSGGQSRGPPSKQLGKNTV